MSLKFRPIKAYCLPSAGWSTKLLYPEGERNDAFWLVPHMSLDLRSRTINDTIPSSRTPPVTKTFLDCTLCPVGLFPAVGILVCFEVEAIQLIFELFRDIGTGLNVLPFEANVGTVYATDRLWENCC